MRHAADADHIAAVSTIVSRQRSLRSAALVGALWGMGHTLTVTLVGAFVLGFALTIPPRIGPALELAVGLMLVVLGTFALAGCRDEAKAWRASSMHPGAHAGGRSGLNLWQGLRPLLIGVVHGLAGSAAIALVVAGRIGDVFEGVGYLLLFGAGTVAGMTIITVLIAMPFAYFAEAHPRLRRWLIGGCGLLSIGLGLYLLWPVSGGGNWLGAALADLAR